MEKVFSRFYYPIEYYNPHVHLEYNFDNSGFNEAEIKALLHEEYKNKYEKIKEIKNKEYVNKYNKSAQLYEEEQRMKNREEELKRKSQQSEQLLKKQNYNKSVYNKNMKNYLKEKEQKQKEKAKTINKLKKSKSLNKQETKMNNKLKSQKLEMNSNEFIIFDKKIQKEINDGLGSKENLDKYKNENIKDKDAYYDNNVVDLRYELENQLLEEIRNKNRTINNNELKDEVNDKLNTIKKFRNFGCLPGHSQENVEKLKSKENKNKKFSSEYERRRFIKSFKNAFNERLGKQNIDIQSICICGNLSKKLDTLIENGNLSINLDEIDCKNNCTFYENQKEYLQKINEVLKSVKDLASKNKMQKDK